MCGSVVAASIRAHISTADVTSTAKSTLSHILTHFIIVTAILATIVGEEISASTAWKVWPRHLVVKNVTKATSCVGSSGVQSTSCTGLSGIHAATVVARVTASETI